MLLQKRRLLGYKSGQGPVGCSAACAAKRSDLIWTARWTDYLSHHHHYRRGASFGLRIRYAGVISVIHLI
jgi:hypothetical protein